MIEPTKKTCPICQNPFYNNDKRRKFCSKECYEEQERQYSRIYNQKLRLAKKDPTKFTRTCPICKNEFYNNNMRYKYCSQNCSRLAKNKHARELYKKSKH